MGISQLGQISISQESSSLPAEVPVLEQEKRLTPKAFCATYRWATCVLWLQQSWIRYVKLDMILHFLLMHLSEKLFGAHCSSQRLFLSYIMVVTVSLVAWALLRLVRDWRERKKSGTLKTKAFNLGHVCEHVCDTFVGWFVSSRDVKSVPPATLSKSKGGRKKEFLAMPADLAQMLMARHFPSQQKGLEELQGNLGCRPAAATDFTSPVPCKSTLREPGVNWEIRDLGSQWWWGWIHHWSGELQASPPRTAYDKETVNSGGKRASGYGQGWVLECVGM